MTMTMTMSRTIVELSATRYLVYLAISTDMYPNSINRDIDLTARAVMTCKPLQLVNLSTWTVSGTIKAGSLSIRRSLRPSGLTIMAYGVLETRRRECVLDNTY